MVIALEQKSRAYTLTLEASRLCIREDQYPHAVVLDIPKSQLRGVGIGGSSMGAALALYCGKKRLTYRLGANYTMEELDEAFRGIRRFRAPSHTQSVGKADWRTMAQREEQRIPMGLLARGLQLAGFGLPLWFAQRPRGAGVFLGLLLLMGVCLGTYLAFPAWFTVIPEKERKKAGIKARVYSILSPFFLYVLNYVLLLSRTFGYIWQWRPVLIWFAVAVAVGVLLGVVLWRFGRECREHWEYAWYVGVFACLFVTLNLGIVNHALSPQEPEQVIATVQARDVHRHRANRWYACTVEMEGQELQLTIGRETYEALETGSPAPIYWNEGALGIHYGWFDHEKWDAVYRP